MSRKPVFDSILSGLNEALEDAKKETPSLKRHRITVIPLKVYEANDIKKIRASTGLSQKYFASYMGVSIKTVEAWEKSILLSLQDTIHSLFSIYVNPTSSIFLPSTLTSRRKSIYCKKLPPFTANVI